MWLLAPAVLLVPVLISTFVSMQATRGARSRRDRWAGVSIAVGSLAGLAVTLGWAHFRSQAGQAMDRSLWEGVAVGGVMTAALATWIVTVVRRSR